MGKEKLEARQEKTKEKFEEKARAKKEEEKLAAAEKPKEKKKEKKKVEVKKPKVFEAKGRAEYLPISPKVSVEVCRAIRGKDVAKARRLLNDVIKLKTPIRFYRYNKEVAHRKGKGFGAGRFPVKASKYILDVLENAIANAKYLNLDEEKLYVKSAISNRAVSKEHGGKYTHVEIVVAQKQEKVKA
ncbi:MAG: 50S ribosomal protein L22 [Nanoarchaeota archaeon]|nr:50S ribosomal protein L22 [Nanoarchaeota archaeon]